MQELIIRPRRLRMSKVLRDLVAEARLDPRMLVQPHFVVPGSGISEPIGAMPGISHQSVDRLVELTGLAVREVGAALGELEIQGRVGRIGPGMFLRAP